MLRLSGGQGMARTIGGWFAIVVGLVLAGCAWLDKPAIDAETGERSPIVGMAEKLPDLADAGATIAGVVGSTVPGAQPAIGVMEVLRMYADGVEARLAELREDQRATNRDYLLAILGLSAAGNGANVLLSRKKRE